MGIQLQVFDYKKFKSDTHVIACQLHGKKARREAITIENFAIDTTIIIIIVIIIIIIIIIVYPSLNSVILPQF